MPNGIRWSIPGDLASIEPDGTITVHGRGSASINSGGEKIFPEEVEAAIKSHPDVFDAIVVGVPDDRFGERVAAVVRLRRSGSPVALEDIQDHCRALDRQVQGARVSCCWWTRSRSRPPASPMRKPLAPCSSRPRPRRRRRRRSRHNRRRHVR